MKVKQLAIIMGFLLAVLQFNIYSLWVYYQSDPMNDLENMVDQLDCNLINLSLSHELQLQELSENITQKDTNITHLLDLLYIDPPNITGSIDMKGMDQLLRNKVTWCYSPDWQPVDDYWELCNCSDMHRFKDWVSPKVNSFVSKKNIMDCDDRACFIYGSTCVPGWSGLAIGIGTFKNYETNVCHMACIFIDDQLNIWMLEQWRIHPIQGFYRCLHIMI